MTKYCGMKLKNSPRQRCQNKTTTKAGWCRRHDPEVLKEKERLKEEEDCVNRMNRERQDEIRVRKRIAGADAINTLKAIARGDIENPVKQSQIFFFERKDLGL